MVSTPSLAEARVVAYVQTADLTRARDFYESGLRLPVESEQQGVVVLRAGDVRIRLVAEPSYRTSSELAVLGFDVADLDGLIQDLRGRGVHTERTSFTHQDVQGVWTSPDGDRLAWVKDPDGNIITLSQAR